MPDGASPRHRSPACPPKLEERRRALDAVLCGTIAAVTAAGSIFFMSEPLNDHFLHLAWAQQVRFGDLPLRDFDEPGMPLQILLSAAMQLAFGGRLLGEALLVAAAFAVSAVLLYILGRRMSGSRVVAAVAASAPFVLNPRSYSYPKLLVYAVGAWLLCRYLDRPADRPRVVAIGLWAAIALLFRLDHGLYLAVVYASAILLVHPWRARRAAAHQLATAGLAGALLLLPWLVWVHATYGIPRYVEQTVLFAQGEAAKNSPWPEWHWPITTWHDIIARERPLAVVGIRWAPGTTAAQQAEIEARYGLERCCGGDRFALRDVSRDTISSLVDEPHILDSQGIDRVHGQIASGWARLRARVPGANLDILPALGSPADAAAFLYVLFCAAPVVVLIAALREWTVTRRVPALPVVLVLLGLLTVVGFLRNPLPVRIPEVLVPQFLLLAWLWGCTKTARALWRPVGLVVLSMAIVGIVRAGITIGATPLRIERLLGNGSVEEQQDRWREARAALLAAPPGAALQGDRVLPLVVNYLRRCTRANDPVLVMWFAPEVYSYSERQFAGRLAYYSTGFWDSPATELANVYALERDRPPVVFERPLAVSLATFPKVMQFLDMHYRMVAEIGPPDDPVRVSIRRDLSPLGDSAAGVPCYGTAPAQAVRDGSL